MKKRELMDSGGNYGSLLREARFQGRGMVNEATFSKDSRRMRPEKRPLNLKIMKLYVAFARAVSMKQ